MSKHCLISFASNGRENYNKALQRMIKTSANRFDGDYIVYSREGAVNEVVTDNGVVHVKAGLPNNCEEHSQVPYQFKPMLFKQAFDAGYETVLWCDSTITLSKPVQPLMKKAEKEGVVLFENTGHPLQNYITDQAKSWHNVSDIELSEIDQIMACCMIISVKTEKGRRIFDQWYKASMDGVSFLNGDSSNPDFKGHRHDQAIMSIIAHRESVKLLSYGYLVYQPHDTDFSYGDHFYFVNKAVS